LYNQNSMAFAADPNILDGENVSVNPEYIAIGLD
jgi:hypothetical protein